MDFENCIKNGFVKKVKPDKKIVKKIYNLASKKLAVQSFIPLNNDHSEIKFILFFDSLTQFIDAIALENGYQINSIECYSLFMNEVLKEKIISKRIESLVETYKSMKFRGNSIDVSTFNEHVSNLMELISFIGEKYFQSQ